MENRWGKQLKTEKIKSIVEKYKRPKNRKKLHSVKVNKGAWENLKWDKKADLRLSNMQQTLTKVGCITLQMADFMLKNAKKTLTTKVKLTVRSRCPMIQSLCLDILSAISQIKDALQ